MRPTPAGVEVARALIARVKAADSSINRRDELWYASDSDALDRRDWHVRRFAPADSMGNGPVTEWVARLEKPEQAYTAAVLRDDALRVVLEWLRSELPWCLTWAPVLGSLHRWQQVWTPNRLRRYEGAAHAERCSRPTAPSQGTRRALTRVANYVATSQLDVNTCVCVCVCLCVRAWQFFRCYRTTHARGEHTFSPLSDHRFDALWRASRSPYPCARPSGRLATVHA